MNRKSFFRSLVGGAVGLLGVKRLPGIKQLPTLESPPGIAETLKSSWKCAEIFLRTLSEPQLDALFFAHSHDPVPRQFFHLIVSEQFRRGYYYYTPRRIVWDPTGLTTVEIPYVDRWQDIFKRGNL